MKKAAPKKTTPEQIQQIQSLHHTGLSAYEIAKKLKINYSVAKYHIDKGNKSHTPAVIDQYEKYKKQNVYLMKTNKLLVELIEQMNSEQ